MMDSRIWLTRPPAMIILFHNEKNGTFRDTSEPAGIVSEPVSKGMKVSSNPPESSIDYDHDRRSRWVTFVAMITMVISIRHRIGSANCTKSCYDGSKLFRVGNQMWRNDGNGRYRCDGNRASRQPTSISRIGSDYNNDRAVDIVARPVRKRVRNDFWESPRRKFSRCSCLDFLERTPRSDRDRVLDFDHDGWMDLAFALTMLQESPSGATITANPSNS